MTDTWTSVASATVVAVKPVRFMAARISSERAWVAELGFPVVFTIRFGESLLAWQGANSTGRAT